MAPDPAQVVVAASGNVYVAPNGTALPAALAALAAPWLELGYVGEDGVTFTVSRETEELNAWQSTSPIRQLTTSEPKTIAMELMEFGEPDAIRLAFRGGAIAVVTGVATYTPPAAGARDIRALVIDAIDGAYTFRFCFSSVELTGDVETVLAKADAARLPLEFTVLAGTWLIRSNHPSWVAGVGELAGGPRPAAKDVVEAIGTGALSDAELDVLEQADDRKSVQEAIKAERERRATATA